MSQSGGCAKGCGLTIAIGIGLILLMGLIAGISGVDSNDPPSRLPRSLVKQNDGQVWRDAAECIERYGINGCRQRHGLPPLP